MNERNSKMITKDMLPLSFIEGEDFQKLMEKIDHIKVGAGTSKHVCDYEKDHGEDRVCSNNNELLDIFKNRVLHDHNLCLLFSKVNS